MLQLLSRVSSKLSAQRGEYQHRSYPSFGAALADSNSYEDPRLIEVVSKKTRLYKETLLASARTITSRQTAQNLFVLLHILPKRRINVLEVGGACGASYFEIKQLLPDRVNHWSITETLAMVAAANMITNEPDLSFHDDLDSAASKLESRDLAIAQGVLQYASDPVEMLKALFALEFSYVYITRTVVADVSSPVFIRQDTELAAHGPGRLPNAPGGKSTQPMTLVSYDSLVSTLPGNYEVIFEFVESDERVLVIGKQPVKTRDVGFLAGLQLNG